MGFGVLGDPEAEAGEKQKEGHEREGGQQQIAPTKGVDGVQGRDGEQPVDDAEPQRGGQRRDVAEAGVLEDGRGVVSDDVDAAELLHEHEPRRGDGRVAVAPHGEEFLEAVALLDA